MDETQQDAHMEETKEEIGAARHPRPSGAPPKWGSGQPKWNEDIGGWFDDEGNRRPDDQRTQDKNLRRRTPEAQERNRMKERERKKKVKERKIKEEQRLKEELEAPASGAGTQPPGAPPGAAAQEGHTLTPATYKLTRENGYDTTNNLNLLLTQCFNCSISDQKRKKPNLMAAVIRQVTHLEENIDMIKHLDTRVCGHSVLGMLLDVGKELQEKNPNAKRLDYSTDFRKGLKDVLLSPVGTVTVRAMVKEVGPEEDELPQKKLKTEYKAMMLELAQLRDIKQVHEKLIEAQHQKIEALQADAQPQNIFGCAADATPSFGNEEHLAWQLKAAAEELDFSNFFPSR